MIEKIYTIDIYKDESGKEPFTEWIETLEKTDQARIDARLDRILAGNLGEYKHIDGQIYELKFKNHSGFRIYYGIDGKTLVILLNGGNKGTQNKDIMKAKTYWKDYITKKSGV